MAKKKVSPYEYMMAAMERAKKQDSAPRMDNGDLEHDLQCDCVKYFRAQYPKLEPLLFAVPNGGFRNKATAGKMKAEGVRAGVSDLLLLVPNKIFHGLCLETKILREFYDGNGKFQRKKSYQEPEQKEWQAAVEQQGYMYVVYRTLDEFMHIVDNYLSTTIYSKPTRI